MFQRQISETLLNCVKTFPVTVLTGPRQSGKTTILKTLFTEYQYYSLENPETLLKITTDPKAFLENHKTGIIFDEAQKYPELFSYIQIYVDKFNKPGQFILSGSQNFLLTKKVSQTLAGRAAILELLPLSYQEYLSWDKMQKQNIWTQVFNGGYPRPYEQNLDRYIWQNSYIQTYLERDVRSLLNIKDLIKFRQFLSLCAGRHGQILNMNELANDAGISHTTVKEWISLLEASYILFRLPPYHKNFNKRIIKSSKLYFYDSGLVSLLLGIETPEHLKLHVMRGAIFEGYIIAEFIKYFLNKGRRAPVYFWRDYSGNEIDLLIERGEQLTAIEIKSGQTFTKDMLKGVKQWNKISGNPLNTFLIYGGEESFEQNGTLIKPWDALPETMV